ncbi:MAG TPA: DegT/DnrJ/EryC1/StrS family aminotransferase [Candidatus Baltobacteraceae bacterium]|nr:DegT/DnrJ/EryC1/StrS family aminotransferase [Candidatus Baltobacteraceae bacterium]
MDYDVSETLAIQGGPKAKRHPFPKGKRHGVLEKQYLNEVIDSDMLFFYLGTKVRAFERRFAEMYGMRHCIACSSGTSAVHMAVAALQIPYGSEVITSAITDMGSLTGVLYQGLAPVFSDVDPDTLNMTPADVRQRITEKTGAIMIVHHAGLAADLDGFVALGKETGIPIIEDCAQAYRCIYHGKLAGTLGAINTFSLNHFKHITCGSGGMVLTNDDRLRYHASIFLDKCYQRDEGLRNPFFLAPNYQMTELQGAVALAQIEKVESVVASRNRLGVLLDDLLKAIPGVTPQKTPEGQRHSYFLYLFRLDPALLTCTSDAFSQALNAEGVPNKAHLITGGMPVYLYDIFQRRSAFPGTEAPLAGRTYRRGDCPVAEAAFDRWITMNIYEHYTETDIREIAHAVAKVARHFRKM